MEAPIDIETLPTDNPDVIADFQHDAAEKRAAAIKEADEKAFEVRAPSNYKDEAKIAEYIANKQQDIRDGLAIKLQEIDEDMSERIQRTGLDGLYGRIACICYGVDDGQVQRFSIKEQSEADMLRAFFKDFAERTEIQIHGGRIGRDDGLVIIGHNVAGFDLNFIKHRAVVNGITPPGALRKAFNAKPWDTIIGDTMLMWNGDRSKAVSLEKLCKVFGLKSKGDIDGSKVAEVWATDPDKVIEYCADDVVRAHGVYRRLTFNSPANTVFA